MNVFHRIVMDVHYNNSECEKHWCEKRTECVISFCTVHLNSRMHRMRRKKQRKRDEREAAAEKMLAAAVASSKDKHSDSENDS